MAQRKRTSRDGKRGGNNEGTISWRPKEGRYEGHYTVQTSHGPKRKVVYGKQFEETRAKLAQAIADRDMIFDAENLTVAEYLRRWLKGPAKKNVRTSTYARSEQLATRHVIPALGKLKLKKLTAVHLEMLYDAKLEEGLVPRPVNYIHVTVSKALNYAVGKDLLGRNMAAFAETPQPETSEIRPLNAGQAATFLHAARGDRLEALYVLALSTGMRRSEILGLMEEDLDLEAEVPTLQIQRGLTVDPKGGVLIQKTKRKSSQRLLELSPGTVAALKQHRKRRAEE